MRWRLNRLIFPVYNLGPGKRLGIWVQGCSIGCPGCISPALHNSSGGTDTDIATFVDSLKSVMGKTEGITISGGEPFDQYQQLIAFCSFAKMKFNAHIFVFTGYTMDQLYQRFPDRLFTRCIDMLIDGPYIRGKHENKNRRGSSNQNLYRFEPLNPDAPFSIRREVNIVKSELSEADNRWSLCVEESHDVFLSGIPGKDDLSTIEYQLKKSGIKLEF